MNDLHLFTITKGKKQFKKMNATCRGHADDVTPRQKRSQMGVNIEI